VAGWTQCYVRSLPSICVQGTAPAPHKATTIHGSDDALPVHHLLTGKAVCMQILALAPDSLEDAWCDTIRVAEAKRVVLNIQSMRNPSFAPLHPRAARPRRLALCSLAAVTLRIVVRACQD